ncbi:MAG: HAD family phosphatase [Treponemataceae bacterium]
MISGSEAAAVFRPAAVIFDMDGLMLDTERPAVFLWVRAARESGWDIDESVPMSTIGLNEANTRASVMETCGPSFPYDTVRARLIGLCQEHFEREGIAHRPGLLPLLDTLAELGVPLAVATSTVRSEAMEKLRWAGIADRFTAFACGDEVARGKPAPDIFLLAASRLSVDPSACVGFEDSPAGLRALAAAGIRSVFVKDMIEPPADVLATVWRRCVDLSEAIRLFG